MYYLQTRYYDLETGRFINADGVISSSSSSVHGFNQFSYSFNNPLNLEDQTGNWPKLSNIKNWAKKTIKKIGEALEKAFVFEVGVGVGFGASTTVLTTKLNVEAYQDGYTFGYANGSSYSSVKISAGVNVELPSVELDGDFEIEHRHETDYRWLRDGHDAFSSPFELAKCKNSIRETPRGFSIKALDFSNSSSDVFVGFGGSKHFVVGGQYQIGFNVTKFIEVFADE